MKRDNTNINNLSEKETIMLFNQMKEGSTTARIELITSNIALVTYTVNKLFFSVECDKEELISVGKIGLLKAINTFDLSMDCKFSTYACQCIKNEIYIFMRHIKKWQKVLDLDGVVVCKDKDNSELKLMDILPDEFDMEQEYEHFETIIRLKKLLNQIPDDRNKKIVMLYFGFYNEKTYTQNEIASMMNISRSNIQNIIKSIVNSLRIELEEDRTKYKNENNKKKIKTVFDYYTNK